MTNSTLDPLGICGTLIAEKYRISHVVGEGGFSVVYKAEHTIWQQPVAIKCFKILANAPEDRRGQLLDEFIQEGKLMAVLSSRSAAIVQARDVGTFTAANGAWIPYMVLEWLEGQPLDLILHEEAARGMPPRLLHEVIALLEPAAVALDLVHSRGIAHRDVKPANLVVLGDPRGVSPFVKVLDFGIAKVMADHAQEATQLAQTGTEITAFTPTYGAPEQFSRSHGATGPWTDVFAMALVVIEMMRGKGPVLDGGDYLQLAVASRDPSRRPTPRTLGIDVPLAVDAVFARALAVDPQGRYRTMGQFWGELHRAVFPDTPTWTGATSGGGPMSGGAPMRPGGGFATGQPVASVPTAPTDGRGPGVQTNSGVGTDNAAPAERSLRGLFVFGAVATVALAAGGFFALRALTTGPGPSPSSTLAAAATSAAPVAPASASAAAARRTECPPGMVLIPGGKFFMGSDDPAFKLWQPSHRVTLDTFCIDVDEVTAGDYKACSDRGDCRRPEVVVDYPKGETTSDAEHEKNKKAYAELCNFGAEGRAKHPMNCVSWALSDAYCKEQKRRLPTEAEWEYAARGSDGRKYPWGDDPGNAEHMNACGKECNAWERAHGLKLSPRMYEADDGFPGTAPVGSFPKGKTRFGANDFIGNVWEWTADWFETYKPDEAVNPHGAANGDRKAIRGGGFNGGVQMWLSPAFRYHQLATASSHGIGFRCAVSL